MRDLLLTEIVCVCVEYFSLFGNLICIYYVELLKMIKKKKRESNGGK